MLNPSQPASSRVLMIQAVPSLVTDRWPGLPPEGAKLSFATIRFWPVADLGGRPRPTQLGHPQVVPADARSQIRAADQGRAESRSQFGRRTCCESRPNWSLQLERSRALQTIGSADWLRFMLARTGDAESGQAYRDSWPARSLPGCNALRQGSHVPTFAYG